MEQCKRKKVVVSIEDKLKAIKRLDMGETIKNVAKDYGVGEVTVGDWRRNRRKIEQWCSNQPSTSQRKTMKDGEYEKINKTLFLWFTQQRSKGVPISGPILQQKAVLMSKEFPETSQFTASAGWLDRWKKRYGVRQLSVCGEKLSADFCVTDKFIEEFNQFIKDNSLTSDQIYNCDESGLNYKMLPAKTLASRQENSAPGHKRSKERLTIMACANQSGKHKLPLMVIGKSAHPRALKNLSPQTLPVYYTHQKSAWMDSVLFKRWFYDQFVPEVSRFLKKQHLPVKAVLLMDNAPSHPTEEELRRGEIVVKFLPPNVTSVLQPMDQGVLENIKKNYRRLLLEHLLESTENSDLISSLRSISIKNVVYWISQAWDSVQESTIQKSWSKLSVCSDDSNLGTDSEDDDLPLSEIRRKCRCASDDDENETLLNLMQQLRGCETVTETDIKQWTTSDDVEQEYSIEDLISIQQPTQGESENDEDETEEARVSHKEGFASLEKALLYVEQQPEATAADVLLIKRWRDAAAKKRRTMKMKQTSIKQFFT